MIDAGWRGLTKGKEYLGSTTRTLGPVVHFEIAKGCLTGDVDPTRGASRSVGGPGVSRRQPRRRPRPFDAIVDAFVQ